MKYHIVILALLFMTCLPSAAQATRTDTILHEKKMLAAGQVFQIDVNTQDPLQIGWRMSNDTPNCEESCVSAEKIDNEHSTMKIEAQHGASMEYTPSNGKITIAFTNISNHDVTIDIYSRTEICDSEACALLKQKGINYPYDYGLVDFDWKRARIAEVTSMETSEDGSYSHITGKTLYGGDIDLYTIWWLIESPELGSGCKKWIPQNAGKTKNNTEKHYFFAGSFITINKENSGVMTDIGCSYTDLPRDNSDL